MLTRRDIRKSGILGISAKLWVDKAVETTCEDEAH